MRSQHPALIEQENHLVSPTILANSAFGFSVDDSLASHVPYVWTDLALEGFAILDNQVVSGGDVFRGWLGAASLPPIDTLVIGLRSATGQ